MNIRCLDWDSAFFGLRIGRADVSSAAELELLATQEMLLKQQCDLLYVFCPQTVRWQQHNAALVDEKTIYTKRIVSQTICTQVDVYMGNVPDNDLYRLALVSGEYSRYRLDKWFPEGSYERLYRRWIEQAVNGNMADKVFVYRENNHIYGMLTLQWDDHQADIGLVAVDTDVQGRGIGSLLMQNTENWLAHNTSVQTLKVATQWTNTKARRWYEKNGFVVECVTNIYHWWLR